MLCGGDDIRGSNGSIMFLLIKDEHRLIKVEANEPNAIGGIDWEPTHNLILGGKIQ